MALGWFQALWSATYSPVWWGWNCFGMVSGPVGCRLATYRQPSKVYWWMHGFGVVPGPVSRRHTAQYEGD